MMFAIDITDLKLNFDIMSIGPINSVKDFFKLPGIVETLCFGQPAIEGCEKACSYMKIEQSDDDYDTALVVFSKLERIYEERLGESLAKSIKLLSVNNDIVYTVECAGSLDLLIITPTLNDVGLEKTNEIEKDDHLRDGVSC